MEENWSQNFSERLSQKTFLYKTGLFEAGIYQLFLWQFSSLPTQACLLIKIDQTFWRKALKMKVKASDIFGAKINKFLFRKKFLAFTFWC